MVMVLKPKTNCYEWKRNGQILLERELVNVLFPVECNFNSNCKYKVQYITLVFLVFLHAFVM